MGVLVRVWKGYCCGCVSGGWVDVLLRGWKKYCGRCVSGGWGRLVCGGLVGVLVGWGRG